MGEGRLWTCKEEPCEANAGAYSGSYSGVTTTT